MSQRESSSAVDSNDTSSDTSFEDHDLNEKPKESKYKQKENHEVTDRIKTNHEKTDRVKTDNKKTDRIKSDHKKSDRVKTHDVKSSRVKRDQKKADGSKSNIDYYKKCIKLLGIRLNYKKIFEDCESDKQKKNKLIERIREAGIEDRITLKACEKRGKKLALQMELEELDSDVVIDDKPRSCRAKALKN